MKRLFPVVLVILFTFPGCYYDKEVKLYGVPVMDCAVTPASFTGNVKPIIQTRCAVSGCHNSTGLSGGVVLETYSQIRAKADRIYQRCVIQKSMPPIGPLPPSEIAVIKCWIEAGAPNN